MEIVQKKFVQSREIETFEVTLIGLTLLRPDKRDLQRLLEAVSGVREVFISKKSNNTHIKILYCNPGVNTLPSEFKVVIYGFRANADELDIPLRQVIHMNGSELAAHLNDRLYKV